MQSLSNDVLFSIMLEMDIVNLEAMCKLAHTVSKICDNYFWNTKIYKDFDIQVDIGNTTEYKFVIEAYNQAIVGLLLLDEVSLYLTEEQLYSILPQYIYIKLDSTTEGYLELIPEWASIDGTQDGGYIQWQDKIVRVSKKVLLKIYTKYIYLYDCNCNKNLIF